MENERKTVDPYVFPHEREDLTLRVRPTANAWWKDLLKLYTFLDAIENHCSSIGEACYIAGITRRQYKYFAQEHPVIYERIRRAKFAKRERELERKQSMYAHRIMNGNIKDAIRYLRATDPEEYDLRYRSTYARLRRIHGLPAHNPTQNMEEQLRDTAATIEDMRIMLGYSGQRRASHGSNNQEPVQPDHTTAV